jgi:hypothetical protein
MEESQRETHAAPTKRVTLCSMSTLQLQLQLHDEPLE